MLVPINAVEASGLKQACPALVEVLGAALEDEDRLVPGYAVEALERIGTPAAITTLLPFLKTPRWCKHTSIYSID